MIYRSKILSYLKVGYLLHLMTILEISFYIIIFQKLNLGDWLNNGSVWWKWLILFPFAIAPFFPQLDAYSRFQNYKQIKDHLYKHGFQVRIIKPFMQSRCQRDAVLVASEELGFREECISLFKNQGYKWFHLLPDFLFTHPSILFGKAFWLNTFFAKTYTAKYDFKKLSLEIFKPSKSMSLVKTI